MADVREWLDSIGLAQYADDFVEGDIDWEVLRQLDHEVLKELGVSSPGHRLRILKAVSSLNEAASGASTEGASSLLPSAPKPTDEAERRQLTVLFADLVGSTELSRQLDPEDLREINRAYQDAAKAAIEHAGGYVARYMGDGVLAYFGYPRAHEDDAERALRAGLSLAETVPKLDAEVQLAVRVGIATGPVVVGDIVGEGASQESAVVGETPNLAARLQGEAEPNTVVISETTQALTTGLFEFEELPPRLLKGFAGEVSSCRVKGEVRGQLRFAARSELRLSPFIGRDEELSFLERRWSRITERQGQAVLIVGEAGIGKSRLVEQFREGIAAEPHEVILLQCSAYRESSALHPVIALLDRQLRTSKTDDAQTRLNRLQSHLDEVSGLEAQTLGLFAHLLSLSAWSQFPEITAMDAPERRERTLRVLTEYVLGRALCQPVIALFEDMHWADPSTVEFIGRLAEAIDRKRVLLIATTRPGFEVAWSDSPHAGVLNLSRMDAEHSAELIRGAAPEVIELTAGVLNSIVSRAGGNPLYVEELARAVIGSSGQELIPATLQDSLMARLDALAEGKAVAQYASVIGRTFGEALLAEIWEEAPERLASGLEVLAGSGLISRRGETGLAGYAFKHALVRDAAYASLLRRNRRRIHERISKQLQAEPSASAQAPPELIAHHCTEAGFTQQAVGYWQQAGQHALSQSANQEAVNHFGNGLDLLQTLPDDAARTERELELLVGLGRALVATKGTGSPEVKETYTRAHRLCDELGETALRFPVLRGLMRFEETGGHLERARELGDAYLDWARREQRPALLLEAHSALVSILCYLGEFGASREQLQSARALFADQSERYLDYGSIDAGVACLGIGAHTLWYLGYPEQALQTSREALTRAKAISHPLSMASALSWAARVHQLCRDSAGTQEQAEAVLTLANAQGFPQWAAQGTLLKGWARAQQGDGANGIEQILSGLGEWRATGARSGVQWRLLLLADVYGQTGHPEQGLSALQEALEVVQRTGDRRDEAEIHRLMGTLTLRAPSRESTEVESHFQQAVEVARRQQARSYELRASVALARLWSSQSRCAEARELLTPLNEWFTEGFDTPDLREAKALLQELS